MKKVHVFTTLILLITTLSSCKFGEGDGRAEDIPYYSFSTEERGLTISHEYFSGDIITYKNQLGEELHFRVISVDNGMEEYVSSSGSFWGSYTSVYRENHAIQRIQIEIVENTNEEEYSRLNYVFSKRNNEFNGGLNFPMWNKPAKRTISETVTNIDLLEQGKLHGRISMEINGHLFLKVFKMSSLSSDAFNDPVFGMLSQNIHEIYYDDSFGIVQFEDIDGNIWKLIYPN